MRPTKDEMFIRMLDAIKVRSTCPRRATAAIITDREGRALSMGYNGVPKGLDHCSVTMPCAGIDDPSGDSSRCLAVHAEQNAALQCRDLQDRAHTIYCSATPCFTCAKMILNTSIKRVVAVEVYPDERALVILNHYVTFEIVAFGQVVRYEEYLRLKEEATR